ncbi:ParB/RepB/Spo0J family partition protein [Streptomyces sp. NPDC101062]|uniref:ParB/RepB/Spo0J family partition protein n=1 Tax=unclassified Streptomyces TaxID=2593676 RepID=UPI0037F8BC5D
MERRTVARVGPDLPNLSEVLPELTADGRPSRLGSFERRSVPLDTLNPADSPRMKTIDQNHVDVLTELNGQLPPIVVHRPTRRVVDGMHRVDAARRRGDTAIDAYLLDVPERDLFALSVRLNTAHGMPLSYAERVAAAGRLLGDSAGMSDRYVAVVAGLSARTVARIRRSTGHDPHLNARIGMDGKVHPKGVAQGREQAGRLLAERPEASLREVARAAGISLGTAHDVKKRLQRGEDPMPGGGRSVVAEQRPKQKLARATCETPPLPTAELLKRLRRDPALRSTDSGRVVLRLLALHDLDTSDWTSIVMNLPTHCTDVVAALARQSALRWTQFADQLEKQAQLEKEAANGPPTDE